MTDVPSSGSPTGRTDGRCHWCGQSLIGLPELGTCPECGTSYDPTSAAKLRPWPNAFLVILQLTWPVLALMVIVAVLSGGRIVEELAVILLFAGYAALIAIPINTYFVVRSRLKRHVPEMKRTQGGLLVFRVFGTTVCVFAFLLLLAPAVVLGACLVMAPSFH